MDLTLFFYTEIYFTYIASTATLGTNPTFNNNTSATTTTGAHHHTDEGGRGGGAN